MSMRRAGLAMGALLTIGCTVPREAGFPDVQKLVGRRGIARIHWNQGTAEDEQVAKSIVVLLRRPLTLASVTEIALLNNPKLQGTYERLGVAQADLVQAGLLKNPVLSAGIGFPLAGGNSEFEGSLVQDFLDLFLIPLRKRFARAEFESVKLEVADSVLELAAEARSAFCSVQAQQQIVELQRNMRDAAQATAELADRQFRAGNTTEPELILEQNAYAQTKLDLAQAELQLRLDRGHLDEVLGLWGGSTEWIIAALLSPIPKDEWPLAHVESYAIEHRLDLVSARGRLQTFVAALSLSKAGVIGGLELGAQAHQDQDKGNRVLGPNIRLEIPIFDQRQATRAKLRAQLHQAQRALDALAIEIRVAVRGAREHLLANRTIVEYMRDVALPLRERQIAALQLQYNAMQVGLYQLVAVKQAQTVAYREYIERVRDYWISRARLGRIAGGGMEEIPPR